MLCAVIDSDNWSCWSSQQLNDKLLLDGSVEPCVILSFYIPVWNSLI